MVIPQRSLISALVLLLVAPAASPAPQQTARRSSYEGAAAKPLDPLTPEEVRIVERTARADPRVKDMLGDGRQRLISVEFLALKPDDARSAEETPERPIAIGRHGVALFYRYDGDYGVRAVVDVERTSVMNVSRIEGGQVPLSAEEVSEAASLALKDSSVRRLLGADAERYEIEGLRTRGMSEQDPCATHRCTELVLRRGNLYLAGARIVVDLTAQNVRVAGGQK